MVVGQALVVGRGLREDLLSIRERELRRELELASSFIRSQVTEEPDSAARALARRLGYPVTLLTREGRVVGGSSDLSFQRPGLVVPPGSPELQAALAGDVGFSQRRGSGEVEVRLFAATATRLGGRDLLLQVAVPLDQIQRIVRRRIWRTLGLILPALAVALALTALLGRALARPIQTVTRRARNLSARNFSRRIPATNPARELRELAGAMNRMTEELEGRFRSLESERDEMQALIDCMGEAVLALTADGRVLRANRAAVDLLDFPRPGSSAPVGTLVRQPGLRALLEGALIQPFSAREVTLGEKNLMVSARAAKGGGAVVTFVDVTEIRRLETVRRDFVANASHELKTPLTALRGFAETLLDDDLPEDLRRQWLSSIRSNTLRLQRLVEDLLDLSRLESGGWKAGRDLVELRPLAEDVLTEFGALARDREVTLTAEGDALAVGDEQGLEQVLKNLVENAIRYTPAGGKILLSIQGDGETVRVAVKDTGTGIPTSALSRIFERFFRVDPARSREEGGTGLGLAIVRHLVHAMGGETWAESELGQGTTVFFTLPGAEEDPEGDGTHWTGETLGGGGHPPPGEGGVGKGNPEGGE